jgi:hypothetical protein
MRRDRFPSSVGLAILVSVGLLVRPGVRAASDTLPDRLTDQEFWALSEALSEPNGYFRSDNLVSNEIYFQSTLPQLIGRVKPGGVYLGVGPEQNFTYITAIKPKMVFITDIRRGNLYTHLMYKALFELSADRAEFVSRLFTKPRAAGVTAKSTAAELMTACCTDPILTMGQEAYDRNAKDIIDLLTVKHKLPLTEQDKRGIIDDVYYNFYWYGPAITYSSSSANGGGRGGSFVDFFNLMVATDDAGVERSFLGTEENFRFMKDLESRNMLVPVVGNFGGSKALRAVGEYVRRHDATIGAFYLSNVEQYLTQDGIWRNFCANVASMPLDEHSTFIRSSSQGRGRGGGGRGLMNSLGSMKSETQTCRASPR